jgi:hypothetical protein
VTLHYSLMRRRKEVYVTPTYFVMMQERQSLHGMEVEGKGNEMVCVRHSSFLGVLFNVWDDVEPYSILQVHGHCCSERGSVCITSRWEPKPLSPGVSRMVEVVFGVLHLQPRRKGGLVERGSFPQSSLGLFLEISNRLEIGENHARRMSRSGKCVKGLAP